MKNSRAAFAPIYFLVAGALVVAGALGGTLKLPAFLQKQPPTAQLQAAQAALADARAKQAEAEAKLEQAKADREALTREAGQQAQGDVAGAQAALAAIPTAQLSPEVQVAQQLVNRADSALAVAFGQLSPAQRAEMEKLVGEALAAKGREIEALKSSLAERDNRLAQIGSEKEQLAQTVTQLAADVKLKDAATQAAAAKADTLDRQVVTYAQQKAAAEKQAGSLEAYVSWLIRTVALAGVLLAALYALVHFVLPSLAQEPGAAGWLVTLNKYTRSIASAH